MSPKNGWHIGLTLLPPGEKKDKEEGEDGLDWGEVYTELIAHTSLNYDQIGERTIPQIRAIRINLPKQVASKTFGFTGGGETEEEEKPTQMQTVADRMAFAARFNS